MSMMRAAPTRSPEPRNSSISTRYGAPPMVTGRLIWGVLTSAHVERLMTSTFGFGTRDWIWLTSRIRRPLGLFESAAPLAAM